MLEKQDMIEEYEKFIEKRGAEKKIKHEEYIGALTLFFNYAYDMGFREGRKRIE